MIHLQLIFLVTFSIVTYLFAYALCMREPLAVALVTRCKRPFKRPWRYKMKLFKQARKYGVGLSLATLGANAMAAVPAAVTTALGDAGTDGVAVASAVLVVIVGIAAFKYMRKAL